MIVVPGFVDINGKELADILRETKDILQETKRDDQNLNKSVLLIMDQSKCRIILYQA